MGLDSSVQLLVWQPSSSTEAPCSSHSSSTEGPCSSHSTEGPCSSTEEAPSSVEDEECDEECPIVRFVRLQAPRLVHRPSSSTIHRPTGTTTSGGVSGATSSSSGTLHDPHELPFGYRDLFPNGFSHETGPGNSWGSLDETDVSVSSFVEPTFIPQECAGGAEDHIRADSSSSGGSCSDSRGAGPQLGLLSVSCPVGEEHLGRWPLERSTTTLPPLGGIVLLGEDHTIGPSAKHFAFGGREVGANKHNSSTGGGITGGTITGDYTGEQAECPSQTKQSFLETPIMVHSFSSFFLK